MYICIKETPHCANTSPSEVQPQVETRPIATRRRVRSEHGAGHGLRTESGPGPSGRPPCQATRAPSAPGGPRYPQPTAGFPATHTSAVPQRWAGSAAPSLQPLSALHSGGPGQSAVTATGSERRAGRRERRYGPHRPHPAGAGGLPRHFEEGGEPGASPVPPADGSRHPAPRGLDGPGGAPAAGPRRRRPPGGLRYLPARAVGGSTPRAAPRPFPPSCPGLKLTRRDVRTPPRDLYRPAAARGMRVLAPSAARRGRDGACATRSPAGGGWGRAHARFAFDGPRGVRGLSRRREGRAGAAASGSLVRFSTWLCPAAVRTGCGKALGLRGCLLVEVTFEW